MFGCMGCSEPTASRCSRALHLHQGTRGELRNCSSCAQGFPWEHIGEARPTSQTRCRQICRKKFSVHDPFQSWKFPVPSVLCGPPSSYEAGSDVGETRAARLPCRFQVEGLYAPFIKTSWRWTLQNNFFLGKGIPLYYRKNDVSWLAN